MKKKPGVIYYQKIKHLSSIDFMDVIIKTRKTTLQNMTLGDFSIVNHLEKKSFLQYDNGEVFGRGSYIVFENGQPIYVGAAVKHFLHRFQSHLSIDERENWGWNALLKKLVLPKPMKKPGRLRLDRAKTRLMKCQIIRVVMPTNCDAKLCYALEREIMIGLKNAHGARLLIKVGNYPINHLQQKVHDLVTRRAGI